MNENDLPIDENDASLAHLLPSGRKFVADQLNKERIERQDEEVEAQYQSAEKMKRLYLKKRLRKKRGEQQRPDISEKRVLPMPKGSQ